MIDFMVLATGLLGLATMLTFACVLAGGFKLSVADTSYNEELETGFHLAFKVFVTLLVIWVPTATTTFCMALQRLQDIVHWWMV